MIIFIVGLLVFTNNPTRKIQTNTHLNAHSYVPKYIRLKRICLCLNCITNYDTIAKFNSIIFFIKNVLHSLKKIYSNNKP